jgi:hypothetical protein
MCPLTLSVRNRRQTLSSFGIRDGLKTGGCVANSPIALVRRKATGKSDQLGRSQELLDAY